MGSRLVALHIAAAIFIGQSFAQTSLEGSWQGFWVRDGDSLQVQFEFNKTSGIFSGSFGSDELRVAGIPVTSITAEYPKLHFEIVGDATTALFDGEMQADSIKGEFRDGQAKGTFLFSRQSKIPSSLPEQEVTFANGDVNLSGSLILPGNSGPYPAVVFVHGSGPEGRWASRFLAIHFARNGIASLIFDKRGVGKSTGDWRTCGFEELAGDACAGVAFLRAHPKIDPDQIGLHGHSQGGALAPLIASSCKVAFVIGSAAPGLPMDEIEIYSVENSSNISSLSSRDSSDAATYVCTLVAAAYHGKGRPQLDSLAALWHDRAWFFPPPPQDNNYWSLSRRIGTYDPIAYWKLVHVPVLLLYGELDQRVPPHASAEQITTALRAAGNDKVTVRMFPQADHTFRIQSRGGAFSWPRNAPGYLDALTRWVASQTR